MTVEIEMGRDRNVGWQGVFGHESEKRRAAAGEVTDAEIGADAAVLHGVRQFAGNVDLDVFYPGELERLNGQIVERAADGGINLPGVIGVAKGRLAGEEGCEDEDIF